MQYHLTERKIRNWGKDSFVFWSKNPEGKAVIFIHGFGGSPDNTFSEFETRFDGYEEFKGYDVYFYGYDSLFQQAGVSATELVEFLDSISRNSAKLYNQTSGAKATKRPAYRRFLFVCHSLGAVVSRRALLDANRLRKPWVHDCRLLLFAPAHKGTSLGLTAIISGEALPMVLRLASAATGYFVPTLRELKGRSEVIDDLTRETELLLRQGVRDFTVALAVVWAKKERVVRAANFCEDPQPMVIPKKHHTNVCKPMHAYLNPINIVRAHL